jgi:hypothetical protein
MTEPTRQDALDAADVFFTTLNVVLYHGEKEHVDNEVIAQHAASLRSSVICTSMAEQMDVDIKKLERVSLYLTKRRLEADGSTELLDRMLEQLRDSQNLQN